jgi:glucose/arabinose dehydrogenase
MTSNTGFLSAAIAVLLIAAPAADAAFPTVALKPVVLKQIHSPTTITYAPDGSGRLFVCDQPGRIYIIQGGMMLPTPFLDISATAANVADRKVIPVDTGYSERGLLGLAFHPGFSDPVSPGYRKFYLNYVKPYVAGVDAAPLGPGSPPVAQVSVSVIAEFQVSMADPNVAFPSSERRLLLYTQPQANHNGGQLEFGPEVGPGGERYLYIGVGDGGSQDDNNLGHTGGNNTSPRPTNGLGNSQDKTRLFGKILRIDPFGTNGPGGQYGIPAGNPFVGAGGGVREEIYAYGLRNPWRFAFDWRPGSPTPKRLFCGDVGGGRTEEINIIVSGGNYGWRYKEGVELPTFSSGATTNPMTLPPAEVAAMIDPIARYAHPGQTVEEPKLPELGYSVTGGFVYRGSAIPALQGKYVFGDYGQIGLTDGRMMGLEETPPLSGFFTLTQSLPIAGKPISANGGLAGERILCLGEDEGGEIYVGLKTNNGVLQLGADGLPAGGIYKIVPATTGNLAVTASKDNSMFSESPNNSSGKGVTLFSGVTLNGDLRRALIAFDVSPVPATAVVSSAQVQLTAALGQGTNTPMKLHRVTESWGEGASNSGEAGGMGIFASVGDATWSNRFFDFVTPTPWTTEGGEYVSTASATQMVTSFAAYTWTSPQLASDVQQWVGNPANNNGWILIGDETNTYNAKRIYSREATTASSRPKLTILYATAPPPTHFESWLTTYFPTNYVGQYVDPNASLGGDGIGNLIKYASGLSPLIPASVSERLQAASAPSGPNTVCTYTFRRDALATDLTYVLQASNDLVAWDDIVRSTGGSASAVLVPWPGMVSETDLGGQIKQVTAQETLPSPARRFIRLRVTRTP